MNLGKVISIVKLIYLIIFNYTTNPSFIDNNGNVNIDSMIDNPQTFITTVGLYNDSGDLVAVAKLSQPVTKDFTKEALIRVKLDY